MLSKKATKPKQDDRPTLILIVDNYIPGGVDVVTFQLLKHYAKDECNLVFITNWNNPTLERLTESGLTGFVIAKFKFFLTKNSTRRGSGLSGRSLRYLVEVLLFPWYIMRLSWMLNRFPIASVLCINGGYPGSTLIRAATVATKWPCNRGVSTLAIHSIAFSARRITRPIENLIDRLVFRSADCLIGVSSTCLNALATRPQSRKVQEQHVIRNSISGLVATDQMKVPFLSDSDRVCFFMPCTYEQPKGHHIALQAFSQFLKSGRDGSLIFAGGDNSGYRHVVEEMVLALGLTGKVSTLEHQQDISHFYAMCDVVLAPYLGPESFCLTVLEGITAGRPVIASSIDAIKELYSDCSAVILVRPSDSQDLFSAMMNTEVLEASMKSFNSQEVLTFLSKFDSAFMFDEYNRVLGVNV